MLDDVQEKQREFPKPMRHCLLPRDHSRTDAPKQEPLFSVRWHDLEALYGLEERPKQRQERADRRAGQSPSGSGPDIWTDGTTLLAPYATPSPLVFRPPSLARAFLSHREGAWPLHAGGRFVGPPHVHGQGGVSARLEAE